MMNKHYLLVNILDASGSMANLTDSTIHGYNHYLKSQKGKGSNLVYTVTFNTSSKILRELDTLETGLLEPAEYEAIGGTALFDTIGTTVEKIDGIIRFLSSDWKVIVNVITDGRENSSLKYRDSDIQKLITDRTEKGWVFMYAGAHKDAYSEGYRMRFKQENVIREDGNEDGIKNSFKAFEERINTIKMNNK
jgi:uncharacterized protein YegL